MAYNLKSIRKEFSKQVPRYNTVGKRLAAWFGTIVLAAMPIALKVFILPALGAEVSLKFFLINGDILMFGFLVAIPLHDTCQHLTKAFAKKHLPRLVFLLASATLVAWVTAESSRYHSEKTANSTNVDQSTSIAFGPMALMEPVRLKEGTYLAHSKQYHHPKYEDGDKTLLAIGSQYLVPIHSLEEQLPGTRLQFRPKDTGKYITLQFSETKEEPEEVANEDAAQRKIEDTITKYSLCLSGALLLLGFLVSLAPRDE